MRPITEYSDYRKYMRDYYEERKKGSYFSWREFAKLAGFTSSGYLKLVCDGKTRLSRGGAAKVAGAMGLTGFGAQYFCLLVEYCDAPDANVRLEIFSRMRALMEENGVRILGAEAFDYFKSWINPVVRELAPIMPGAKPSEIAKMCVPEVTAGDVRNALTLMVQAGLLHLRPDGSYVQTNKGLSGDPALVAGAMHAMQKQLTLLAADALDGVAREDRNISGLTFGVDEKTLWHLSEELDLFRQKVKDILSKVENYDRVYRLNLHLFPLSKAKEGKDENQG
ncbi:MAG: TIGR02147 family protein [Fibrobacter sp.]|uniref:TIGR02147 family protein n=1 Tax=Fibrobacter sp. UWR3 TaxID=1896217 RepID=UPI000917E49B|nr:TIGR02147 family protein [Fibrobacter sp. UWR3]MBO6136368.1 TIGR02147 family protein [Fibrobacter sp.]MBQ3720556.1 TIGR02147 family protein [Fibrobacter sp.]MBR2307034.1 TIGR02147 family protein [Fibrobacter sp.]SHM23340.1 TIGR02147 family protein [Fibrobacter sp. UWR3]